jgi:hypothetical protein
MFEILFEKQKRGFRENTGRIYRKLCGMRIMPDGVPAPPVFRKERIKRKK